MVFYIVNLVTLVAANTGLAYHKHQPLLQSQDQFPYTRLSRSDPESAETENESQHTARVDNGWSKIRRQYLIAYALAMAADWLQGAFIYSLYKSEYNLSESKVAALFATGFASGAASALVTGYLADRFGRKKACLAYCAVYALSCALTLTNSDIFLFLGRALGGISTTLVFSVFEAWLVSEASAFINAEQLLSETISTAAAVNSAVAITSGATSQLLAHIAGSKRAPFVGSIVCLGGAAFVILKTWGENYGEKSVDPENQEQEEVQGKNRWPGREILTVSLVACFMEASIYVMVYFWTPSIQRVRPRSDGEAPFGIIFACFMSAMMLGSWIFWHLTRSNISTKRILGILQTCSLITASCLLITIISTVEYTRFYALSLFELCVGLYLPSMAFLKSRVVANVHRGTVYSLMRLPLNILVISLLYTIKDGDAYRQSRFTFCSALLLISGVLLATLGETNGSLKEKSTIIESPWDGKESFGDDEPKLP